MFLKLIKNKYLIIASIFLVFTFFAMASRSSRVDTNNVSQNGIGQGADIGHDVHGDSVVNNIISLIKSISNEDVSVDDLPKNGEFYLIPAKYQGLIIDKLKNLSNENMYKDSYSLEGDSGFWDVYDFSNGNFTEFYLPTNYSSLNATKNNYIYILAINKITDKFIVISKDIPFYSDKSFINALINLSEKYLIEESQYDYLRLDGLIKTPVGNEVQYKFATLDSEYLSANRWGIAIENGKWTLGFAGEQDYIDLLNTLEGDDLFQNRKNELIDSSKNFTSVN